MVRLRIKLETTISSTAGEDRDLGNGVFEVYSDSLGEGGSWKTKVAAAATDVQIQLPNIASAKFVFIRTTPRSANDDPVPLTFKRETTGGEAIIVTPISGSREGYWLATSTLTALYCTNGGTVDMDVTVYAAGD